MGKLAASQDSDSASGRVLDFDLFTDSTKGLSKRSLHIGYVKGVHLEIEPSSLLTEFHESMFVPISTSNVKALIKLFVISNCSSHELDVSEIATELHAKCPYSATFSLSCDVATADPFNVLNEVCLHAGNLNKKAGRKIPSYEPSN